jgi:hypothetical protein
MSLERAQPRNAKVWAHHSHKLSVTYHRQARSIHSCWRRNMYTSISSEFVIMCCYSCSSRVVTLVLSYSRSCTNIVSLHDTCMDYRCIEYRYCVVFDVGISVVAILEKVCWYILGYNLKVVRIPQSVSESRVHTLSVVSSSHAVHG